MSEAYTASEAFAALRTADLNKIEEMVMRRLPVNPTAEYALLAPSNMTREVHCHVVKCLLDFDKVNVRTKKMDTYTMEAHCLAAIENGRKDVIKVLHEQGGLPWSNDLLVKDYETMRKTPYYSYRVLFEYMQKNLSNVEDDVNVMPDGSLFLPCGKMLNKTAYIKIDPPCDYDDHRF